MPNWNFYQAHINNEIASVFLDLDAKSENINNKFNTLFWLFIKLKIEREDGLSHDDEFETLNSYENDLIENIDISKSSYVGRITTNGMRQFYFYKDDLDLLEKNIDIT